MAFRYDPEREPWEKQIGESATAYKAFVEYCAMAENGGRRSCRELVSSGKVKSQYSTVSRWSSENHWQDRVAAFDLHQVEEQRKELRERQERAFDRIAQRSLLLYKLAQERLVDAKVDGMSFKDAREYMRLAVELDMIANHITPQDLDRELKREEQQKKIEAEDTHGSLADEIIAAYEDRMKGGGEE